MANTPQIITDNLNKIDELSSRIDRTLGQNIDAQIEVYKRIAQRGGLTRDQEQQVQQLRLQKIQQQVQQAGTINILPPEDIAFVAKMKQMTETGSTMSGESSKRTSVKPLVDYSKLDKEFAQKLASIESIADVKLSDGTTPLSRLINQVYKPAGGVAAEKDGQTYILNEKTGEEFLPPRGNLVEGLKNFATTVVGQSGGTITGAKIGKTFGPEGAILGAIGGRILGSGAGTAGAEEVNLLRSINAAKKLGIITADEQLFAKEAGRKALSGAIGGIVGQGFAEGIGALPGGIEKTGKFLERFGNRGPAEQEAKQKITEGFLTDKIRNKFNPENRFKTGEIVQSATQSTIDTIDAQANKRFNTVRLAMKNTQRSNRDIQTADLTGYWQELSDKLNGFGDEGQKLLGRIKESFGFSDIPASNIPKNISGTSVDVVTGLGPAVPTNKIDVLTGQKLTTTLPVANNTINQVAPRGSVQGLINPVTGESNVYKANAGQFLNGYNSLMTALADYQKKDPAIFRVLVQAKKALNDSFGDVGKKLSNTIDDTVENESLKSFGSFSNVPKLPERKSLFELIKKGFEIKSKGFETVPSSFRKKIIGDSIFAPLDPEQVTSNILTSGSFLDDEAKIANRLVAGRFGSQAVKDMAEGAMAYRLNPRSGSVGNSISSGELLAGVSPELAQQASAMTGVEQKALQAQGKSLGFQKGIETTRATTQALEEAPQSIRASSIIDVKSKSNMEKSLFGSQNYKEVTQPFQQLLKIQESQGVPTNQRTFFSGVSKAIKEHIPVVKDLNTDTGFGATVGGIVGGGLGAIPGGPLGMYTGAGAGAAAGGLIGAAARPVARAAASGIEQLPTQQATQFMSSPAGKLLGKGITATGVGLSQHPDIAPETIDLLKQLLNNRTQFASGQGAALLR